MTEKTNIEKRIEEELKKAKLLNEKRGKTSLPSGLCVLAMIVSLFFLDQLWFLWVTAFAVNMALWVYESQYIRPKIHESMGFASGALYVLEELPRTIRQAEEARRQQA